MTMTNTNSSGTKGATNTVKMMALATTLYLCTIMWGLQLNHAENIKTRGLSVHGDCAQAALTRELADMERLNAPPAPPKATAEKNETEDRKEEDRKEKKEQEQEKQPEEATSLTYRITDSKEAGLAILPNELPGYTGWARPVFSLVDYFEILSVEQPVATVGQNWTVKVQCKHEAAKNGGALFYVRAYGAALLPGVVEDHQDGTYSISFLPHDEGTYTLEVVLTISLKPDYSLMPNKPSQDPSYEGHMLPGFPITVPVLQDKTQNDKQKGKLRSSVQRSLRKDPRKHDRPKCAAKHLTETSTTSPLETGRWLVTNRTWSFPKQYNPPKNLGSMERINIDNYKNGRNALGIQMDYFYNDCNVLSYNDMTSRKNWLDILGKRTNKKKPIHVLYVGDSNTRNQYNYFRDHIFNKLESKPKWYFPQTKGLASTSFLDGRLKLTYIDMMGHWDETFNSTKNNILKLINFEENKNDDYFISYNAGLHELSHRCMESAKKKEPQIERCHEIYAQDVRQLTELLKSFPASLRVWQDTVAGWPKWGVYGVSWPQNQGQRFPREPNFCAYINEIAFDIMQDEKIPVVDTYWMTLSRPDHREVVQKETIRTSYKLVHLGDEVYLFLVRKWVHMIFEAIEKGQTGVQYL